MSKAPKQMHLFFMAPYLVFGMPLHGDHKTAVRLFDGLHEAFLCFITRRHAQAFTETIDGLVVARIYVKAALAVDLREVAFAFKHHKVGGLSAVRCVNIVAGIAEMLLQSPAVMDIKQLQATADGKDRQVAFERFVDEPPLHVVAFAIGRVVLRMRRLPVARCVDVGAAGEQQAGEGADFGLFGDGDWDGIGSGRAHRFDVGHHPAFVTKRNENAPHELQYARQWAEGYYARKC